MPSKANQKQQDSKEQENRDRLEEVVQPLPLEAQLAVLIIADFLRLCNATSKKLDPKRTYNYLKNKYASKYSENNDQDIDNELDAEHELESNYSQDTDNYLDNEYELESNYDQDINNDLDNEYELESNYDQDVDNDLDNEYELESNYDQDVNNDLDIDDDQEVYQDMIMENTITPQSPMDPVIDRVEQNVKTFIKEHPNPQNASTKTVIDASFKNVPKHLKPFVNMASKQILNDQSFVNKNDVTKNNKNSTQQNEKLVNKQEVKLDLKPKNKIDHSVGRENKNKKTRRFSTEMQAAFSKPLNHKNAHIKDKLKQRSKSNNQKLNNPKPSYRRRSI